MLRGANRYIFNFRLRNILAVSNEGNDFRTMTGVDFDFDHLPDIKIGLDSAVPSEVGEEYKMLLADNPCIP